MRAQKHLGIPLWTGTHDPNKLRLWYEYGFYPQWKRLVYGPAMIYSPACIMSITTDRAVWFVMWLGGRVGLLETQAGKTLSDITWWTSMALRYGEGKRGLPLIDHNQACINMYYIDQISIKSHYTSPVLMGQLVKWTTVLQGHWFLLQCRANGAEHHGSIRRYILYMDHRRGVTIYEWQRAKTGSNFLTL